MSLKGTIVEQGSAACFFGFKIRAAGPDLIFANAQPWETETWAAAALDKALFTAAQEQSWSFNFIQLSAEGSHWGWAAEWFRWEKDPRSTGFTVCTFIRRDESIPLSDSSSTVRY